MKPSNILFITLIIIVFSSQCEGKERKVKEIGITVKEGKTYLIELYGKYNSEFKDTALSSIKIYKLLKDKYKFIQRFKVKTYLPIIISEFFWKYDYIDMNFDGYCDFRFEIERGATGNSWFLCYLYDPKKELFRYSQELSHLCSPFFDEDLKEIVTYERDWNCKESVSFWVYRNGKLIRYKRIALEYEVDLAPHLKIENLPKDTTEITFLCIKYTFEWRGKKFVPVKKEYCYKCYLYHDVYLKRVRKSGVITFCN